MDDIKTKGIKEFNVCRILIWTPTQTDKQKILGNIKLNYAGLAIDNSERISNRLVKMEVEKEIGYERLYTYLYI